MKKTSKKVETVLEIRCRRDGKLWKWVYKGMSFRWDGNKYRPEDCTGGTPAVSLSEAVLGSQQYVWFVAGVRLGRRT
jgi:hypothetical protein